MAKKQQIVEHTPKFDLEQIPDFMQGEEQLGLDLLAQYVYIQLLKVVQKNSPDRILDEFNVGDVFLSPGNILIAAGTKTKEGEIPATFYFTPLYFYTEFITWNKRGEQPAIIDRSFSDTSEIAKLARNSETRKDPVSGISHSEHLNWIVLIHDNDMAQPVVISFARGEFAHGRKFASLIRMRRAGSPLYGMRFQATVGGRVNANNQPWKGFDITNPDDGKAWIEDKALYDYCKEQYMTLDKAFQEKKLRADFSDTESGDEDTAPANSDM